MGTIKTLTKDVVAKIAAGQVVERPASVVKELVENALDANASRIDIEVHEAGLKQIVVTDDGLGMDTDDLELCFKPHTTSKISASDDLAGVATLGFRGEALGSVAAVSELTIASKQQDTQIGHHVRVAEGRRTESDPVGKPNGTQVIVEKLFGSTPARKKALKTSATELRHIIDVVTDAALAHTNVAFTLTHNDKELFALPAKQDLSDRLTILLGEHISSGLFPITHADISGFIGSPQVALSSGRRQYLFVNNRAIVNADIARTIRDAYGTLLDPKSFPLFVLFLTLPHDQIDVNVHPRKEEVHFLDSKTVLDTVSDVVKSALENNDLTYTISNRPSALNEPGAVHMKDALLSEAEVWDPRTQSTNNDAVLQIHNLYLITQTDEGVLMVDQHAAHERILYEEFLELYSKNKHTSKALASPIALHLAPAEKVALEEHSETLTKLGFAFENENLTAIPSLFHGRDPVSLMNGILDELTNETVSTEPDQLSHTIISTLACKNAIKAGDPLSPQERANLLEKLSSTQTNYTCPHGRPVSIHMSLDELARIFKRK